MREGPPFGDTINTAYFTINQVFKTPTYFTPDVFYGNSNGLWQAKLNSSRPFLSAYRHYLDGIHVNKICDIFGLISFGNQAAKENLLVGTDNGFYFSNSLSKIQPDTALDNVTLYHYDPLGNIPINFIEVNNTGLSFPPPFCENGVWVATNNGVYLLKPDYAAHLNQGQLVSDIHFVNLSDTVNTTQICAGDTTRAQLNTDVTTTSLQWFKDGVAIPNQSRDTLAISAAGTYYAVLYDPCAGVHVETNHLTVQTIAAPIFTFDYPNKLQFCDSTSTTLKTDYNPIYHYLWYTNGVLNGDTTNVYTVTQSGKYKVEVSACTGTWIPSKEIEVDLINLPAPSIAADKPKYCAGDTAKLSVNIQPDQGYTINWYKGGSLVSTDQNKTMITATNNGSYSVIITSTIANCTKTSNTVQLTFTPAPRFTFNYPNKLQYCAGTPVTLTVQGSNNCHYRWYKNDTLTNDTTTAMNIVQSGKYKVEVSSCEASWVPSKDVQVNLINIPIPVIKTNKLSYCIGDKATLSISAPTDPNYTISWYKDNNLLTANSNQTSITTSNNSNYSVKITANTSNTDGTICSQASAVQNIVFNPPPTVSIQQIVKTTLCDGQTVDLKVSYSNGTVKWNTGETSDQISVNRSGSYTATITSAAGCSSDTSINVQFNPNPVLNLPNAGVCVPSHKTATITAPEGMTSYTWNGQIGTNIYIADHPQTITLTVTDENGCQATQDIQVTDECPNINIPNAFTPNGDGVNDTWNIKGLEYDATAVVKIFTRYGQQVYESRGYNKPWNGNSNGKQLPAGVYYYIIKTKNSTQTYSGSVTIIY
jgi:gliding motility-associated-like protein